MTVKNSVAFITTWALMLLSLFWSTAPVWFRVVPWLKTHLTCIQYHCRLWLIFLCCILVRSFPSKMFNGNSWEAGSLHSKITIRNICWRWRQRDILTHFVFHSLSNFERLLQCFRCWRSSSQLKGSSSSASSCHWCPRAASLTQVRKWIQIQESARREGHPLAPQCLAKFHALDGQCWLPFTRNSSHSESLLLNYEFSLKAIQMDMLPLLSKSMMS